MLVILLVLLVVGLGGFSYWAYAQGWLRGLPFLSGGENATTQSTETKYTTPPTISNVKITATGVDGFCVTWDTDQFSSSQVEYGPKGSFTSKTEVTDQPSSTSAGVMTAHGVCIKGLQAGTEYQYRCISTNKDGLTGMSEINYVTTPEAEPEAGSEAG